MRVIRALSRDRVSFLSEMITRRITVNAPLYNAKTTTAASVRLHSARWPAQPARRERPYTRAEMMLLSVMMMMMFGVQFSVLFDVSVYAVRIVLACNVPRNDIIFSLRRLCVAGACWSCGYVELQPSRKHSRFIKYTICVQCVCLYAAIAISILYTRCTTDSMLSNVSGCEGCAGCDGRKNQQHDSRMRMTFA